MIPVSPCASVSWISLAIRWRSSSTPASRSDSSRRRLDSVSSSTSSACLAFCTSSTHAKNMIAPATAQLTRTITAQIAHDPASPDGSPPLCAVPVTIATATTPTGFHLSGSQMTEK